MPKLREVTGMLLHDRAAALGIGVDVAVDDESGVVYMTLALDTDRSIDFLARVSAVLKDMHNPNASLDGELRELVRDGYYVRAIKRCREGLGIGLKEARDYVDNLRGV